MPNAIIATASIIRGPQSFDDVDDCKGKLKCLRNEGEVNEGKSESWEDEDEDDDEEEEEQDDVTSEDELLA